MNESQPLITLQDLIGPTQINNRSKSASWILGKRNAVMNSVGQNAKKKAEGIIQTENQPSISLQLPNGETITVPIANTVPVSVHNNTSKAVATSGNVLKESKLNTGILNTFENYKPINQVVTQAQVYAVNQENNYFDDSIGGNSDTEFDKENIKNLKSPNLDNIDLIEEDDITHDEGDKTNDGPQNSDIIPDVPSIPEEPRIPNEEQPKENTIHENSEVCCRGCRQEIEHIRKDVKEILEYLRHGLERPPAAAYDLLPKMPFLTRQSFLDFENLISNNQNALIQFKNKLRRLGCDDLLKIVKNIMNALLDDNLQKEITWTGLNNTIKFSDTTSAKTIIDIVETYYPSINIDKLKNKLADRLRRCGDRIAMKLKKNNMHQQQQV